MSTEKKLAELVAELEAATEQHEEARHQEQAASSAMCAANNRLNAAQKAIDTHMANLRKNAPWNSDWKRQNGVPLAEQ